MDPIVFEHVVGAIFESRGFSATATIASGDEGVDLLLRKGLAKSVVQCKRYSDSVGQPVVRDLYGTMLHNQAKDAYLVTTAMITSQARAWAKGKPIHMIDGYRLVDWVVESNTTSRRQRYTIFFAALLLMVVVFNAYLYLPVTLIERSVNGIVNTVTGAVAQLFSGSEAVPAHSPIPPNRTPGPPLAATMTPLPTPIALPTKPGNPPGRLDVPVQIYFPAVIKEAE